MAFFADDSSLPHLQFETLAKSKGEGSRGGHILGRTKSGKPIYASATAHPGYTKQDHLDAADKHFSLARRSMRSAQRKNEWAPGQHQDILGWGHHGDTARWHQGLAYSASVAKSQHGEGSRGGHIIGHTKSGKPVYEASGPKYAHIKGNQVLEDHRSGGGVRRGYPKFTMMDHDDAHLMHADNEQIHNTAARRASENGRDDLAQAHLAIADSHMMAGLGHKYARQIMGLKGHDYPRHVYREAGLQAEADRRPIHLSDYGEISDPFSHKDPILRQTARMKNMESVSQNFDHFGLEQHQGAIKHHQDMASTLQSFLDDPTKKSVTKERASSIRRQIKAHRALGLAHSDYANRKFSNPGV